MTLNKNTIVVFDNAVINERNPFNTGNGICVVPVTGLYQFTLTIMSYNANNVETELRVDNVVKGTNHIHLNSGTNNKPATKVVICRVQQGEHMWIQPVDITNSFYRAHDSMSSFTGILVFPGLKSKSIQNKTDEEDSFIGVIAKLEDKIENLTRIINQGKQTHDKPVLFFIRLSKITTLNKNSIVKFDEVMINEGNHFNSGDGIFVSPVTGIFQFSWTILTTTSKLVETELMVDNVVVDKLHVALTANDGNISGTKVVLCKVKKGDHVWIQTSSAYASNYFYIANVAKSTFTGMLIPTS
ncbi:unnamed protein product [Mytilus coruscus]|uniref:C1q domain-containing protein n=1 Tax=Mytilus coruscus TaxID=42192 RepID=A0A6J8CNA6_MYTCO|nr:unnamed protein product [Mytilus coruscus]